MRGTSVKHRAEAWREKARAAAVAEAVELTLPSGVVVKARRPDPMQLAAWNRLPFSLVTAVLEGQADAEPASASTIVETAEFMREILVACVVDPMITMTPAGPHEIHPREIPQADWLFVVAWALRVGEVDALRTFRRGGTGDGAGGGGEDVGRAAERAAGDRGSGGSASARSGADGADERVFAR